MSARFPSLVGVIAVFVVLVFARTASAHQPGLSRGEYVLEGDRVNVELSFAHRELATAIPALDEDRDGQLSAQELGRADARRALEREIVGPLELSAGAKRCTISLDDAAIDNEDAVLRAHARCPRGASSLALGFRFLQPFAAGHRHLVHVRTNVTERELVALQSSPSLELDVGRRIEELPSPYLRLGIGLGLFAAAIAGAVSGRMRRRVLPSPSSTGTT
jgi:hypothetical protein